MEGRLNRRTVIFWAAVYVVLLLLLSQVGMSDGDDTYFYIYANRMDFVSYLLWRYDTWVGRMGAEALVYIIFHCNIWVWRMINAAMLVALPLGVIKLAETVGGVRAYDLYSLEEHVQSTGNYLDLAAVSGYLMMSIMTLGYAGIWMNGSIFYTWSFACGIWALVPVAQYVYMGNVRKRWFAATIPFALIAAMSVEQIGAVVLAFEIIALAACFAKKRQVHPLIVIQTVVSAVGFMILFAAPGNDIRVASEIETWMPEYGTLSVGRHILITAQWLLSSFANENKLFLIVIWCVGIVILAQREDVSRAAKTAWSVIAAAFSFAAALPYVGITVLSDLGIGDIDIEARVDHVASFADLDARMWICMAFWSAALIFTFIWIMRVMGIRPVVLLAFAAAIASEAIMYFSPTIYASGARVYYLTDILCIFIILVEILNVHEEKMRRMISVCITVAGVINFISQITYFFDYFVTILTQMQSRL